MCGFFQQTIIKTLSWLPADRLRIQRSCGEIPELFTLISIMAAGTGSTALFTVICVFPFAQTSSSTLDLVSVWSYCFGLWIDSGGDYLAHTSSMGKTF
ncbi:hypothetical protein YC2023_052790 [Brassica napus]